MSAVGKLTIAACWHEGLYDLSVKLERPPVPQLFIGQSPEAVVKMVPYLYSLCSQAQRAVAQVALAAASDKPAREADHAALWIEMLHENLWRVLLDWPLAVGLPQAKDAFVAWREQRHGEEAVAITQRLLAETVRPLAEQCLALLNDGSREASVGQTLAPEAWLDWWGGRTSERPRFACPSTVASAFRARLAEVERATAALAAGEPFPLTAAGGEGWAVGQALTARGVLTHAVHLAEGEVARYYVQAPTDGYFADATPLAHLLRDREYATPEEARRGIEQAVLALDPCLPYEVVIHYA
jgi:hypothetical protein